MKEEKIKLNELTPAEYNPRTITPQEREQLTQNLKEFGLVDPIIINLKNNHIIGGHQRYNVLSKDSKESEKEYTLLRLGDIGWVFDNTNLQIKDENHEKSLNLSLNKISGEWDYNKLTNLLGELKNTHFNMDLTGFNETELSSFNIDDILLIEDEIFEAEYDKGGAEQPYAGKPHLKTKTDNDEEPTTDNTTEKTNFCPKCGYKW